MDEAGNPVRNQEREIRFELEGDARILGVDNGAPDNIQDFQSDRITTDQGRCLLILQSTHQGGEVRVRASAEGMESQLVKIQIL